MITFLQRLFGVDTFSIQRRRTNAAIAMCNRLTAFKRLPTETPVTVTHAQLINDNGEVRMYTDDGRQYLVTVTEMGTP